VANGLVLGLTEVLSAQYVSTGFRDAIGYALLIGFLLVRPLGILGSAALYQRQNHQVPVIMVIANVPAGSVITADDLDVVQGEIPTDLDGVYLRNTENPVHPSMKKYHPFDGDGMIHVVGFRDGLKSQAGGMAERRPDARAARRRDGEVGLHNKPKRDGRPG